jgi:hypothetical protein
MEDACVARHHGVLVHCTAVFVVTLLAVTLLVCYFVS